MTQSEHNISPSTVVARNSRRRRRPISKLPVLDQWQLHSILGRGTSAVVYLASPIDQLESDRCDYAIKMLQRDKLDCHEAKARLRNEIGILGKICSPHLVARLAAGRQSVGDYLVMPRLRGATLDRVLLHAERLTVPSALWIARQVTEALAAMHSGGWIHLDVKPANISVDRSGHATLFDLDLSTCYGSPRAASSDDLRGTFAYAAPELFTSCHSSQPASDVYSLGVTLYQLITGQLPFTCHEPHRWVEAHRTWIAKSPRTYLPHLPTTISRLISRMLAKDPARRPLPTGELQEELSRAEIETFSMRTPESAA